MIGIPSDMVSCLGRPFDILFIDVISDHFLSNTRVCSVPRFDHFCGWINQGTFQVSGYIYYTVNDERLRRAHYCHFYSAVGEQNYRLFLLFLFVHVIMW